MAISLQNRPRCQTLERTDRDADSNHMSESSPFVVISRDESTSPWCQLSCDERNSSEKLMETSGPLDNLAQSQSQASLYAALQVHVSVIMSLSVTISWSSSNLSKFSGWNYVIKSFYKQFMFVVNATDSNNEKTLHFSIISIIFSYVHWAHSINTLNLLVD